MVYIQTLLQIVIVSLAFAGAYFVADTAHAMSGRIDINLLRAKAFLNTSFMRDNWILLLLACFFFLIYASIKLNEMFGILLEDNSSELLQEITVLGVLSCCVLSEYKWFKLTSPAKYNR
ncbi:Uncharacterised protein [uncultured archaeon]|nr:Uncharacterised protein [uncultured archaeon]